MFHPALWKLLCLQWRGGIRRFVQGLKTFRGLFHLAFVIGMLLYGTGSMYFAGFAMSHAKQVSGSVDQIQNDLPAIGLFLFTTYALLFSTGEATLHFTPSEVAFLFPAPFARKQLLSYKLAKSFLGIFGISIFMSIFTAPQIRMAVARLIGIFLTLSFLQLLTMNVAFTRQVLHERIHRSVRIVVGTVVGIALLIAVNQTINAISQWDLSNIPNALHQSSTATILLTPFQFFVRAVRAPTWIAFIPSAGIIVLVDTLLLALAYRLDALSLEAALVSSEKIAARLKSIQSKGVWQAFGAKDSTVARRRVPQFPYWAGVGPVAWQRMTTTFRSSTALLWVMAAAITIAIWIVYLISNSRIGSGDNSLAGSVAGVIAMGYMSLLISLTMQNDIERVSFLKSLPIGTVSIVIGELLGFVVLLSTVQSLFIFGLAYVFPTYLIWLLAAVVLLLPFNFLLFAVDKLVFYVYPTKIAMGTPGDFQNAGKGMIFMTLKMLILFTTVLPVVGATLPGALILQSPVVAVMSAVVVLVIECLIMGFLLKMAFDRFDPSVTQVSS